MAKSTKKPPTKKAKAAKAPAEGKYEITYGDGQHERKVIVDGPDWEQVNSRIVITSVVKVG